MESSLENPQSQHQRPPATEHGSLFSRVNSRVVIEIASAIVILIAVAGGAYYWLVVRNRVYTDNAEISAPLIDLSPEAPGVLKQLFVKEGDVITARTPVARIDNTYLVADNGGLVVTVNNEIGKLFSPGMPVVTMINPSDLRVVALVDEDKGLSDIRVGQKVLFTVDAFGSREFEGVVDEIGKTSEESSIAFNISDKREVKQFEVKIAYDTGRYPELLNGMSARVWIYK